MNLNQYAKAIVAFFTSLAGASATLFADGNVEPSEIIAAVCLVGIATFGVWLVPNQPEDALRAVAPVKKRVPRKAAAKKQAGHVDVATVLVMSAVAIVVCVALLFAFDLIGG